MDRLPDDMELISSSDDSLPEGCSQCSDDQSTVVASCESFSQDIAAASQFHVPHDPGDLDMEDISPVEGTVLPIEEAHGIPHVTAEHDESVKANK